VHHPDPYFDEAGHFIHYCWCGKWGSFGVDCFLRAGKLGLFYCLEHRPQTDRLAELAESAPKRAIAAPDLQELIARHGGYDKIAPEAWAEWDRLNAEWQERQRLDRAALAATPDRQISEDGAQLLIADRDQTQHNQLRRLQASNIKDSSDDASPGRGSASCHHEAVSAWKASLRAVRAPIAPQAMTAINHHRPTSNSMED
jgi:hypothetical protein